MRTQMDDYLNDQNAAGSLEFDYNEVDSNLRARSDRDVQYDIKDLVNAEGDLKDAKDLVARVKADFAPMFEGLQQMQDRMIATALDAEGFATLDAYAEDIEKLRSRLLQDVQDRLEIMKAANPAFKGKSITLMDYQLSCRTTRKVVLDKDKTTETVNQLVEEGCAAMLKPAVTVDGLEKRDRVGLGPLVGATIESSDTLVLKELH